MKVKEESDSRLPRILFWFGGAIFVITLIIGWGVVPEFIRKGITQSKVLTPGSEGRKIWEKFPIPVPFKVYVFNITNVHAVHNGEKPVLEEIGPFVYDEWKEKTGLKDIESNDTVKFHMKTTWFSKKEETGSLTGDEIVYVPNAVLLGMLIKGEREMPVLLGVLNQAVQPLFNNPKTVFLKTTIRKLLFDGNYVNCTRKDFLVSTVCSLVKKEKESFAEVVSNPGVFRYSFFGNKNGTSEASELVVRRGGTNIKSVGEVVAFNGDPQVKVWGAAPCIDIVGTDPTIFPPFLDQSPIYSFAPDFCRSVRADFERVTKFKGIKVLRFTSNFGDVESNPEEECFCVRPETCLKGVIDLSKCTGAPIILSAPHFLDAADKFQKGVHGLHPNKESHGIALDMEPMTGIPLSARKRLQFSIPIHPIRNIPITRRLPDVFVPIFWVEEGMDLSDDLAEQMHKELFNVLYGIEVTKWIILMIGAAIALAGIILNFINPFNRRKQVEPDVTPHINDDDNNDKF